MTWTDIAKCLSLGHMTQSWTIQEYECLVITTVSQKIIIDIELFCLPYMYTDTLIHAFVLYSCASWYWKQKPFL